ncbi:hypothetical protein [Streptococcus ruminantium]|uniref:hypothetical protein n=1 Tax=Streptococcus ruminantium TaxID=1917441 RepID=UPI0012DDC7F5|nr:hypothetical protein [Streptococcus ruminantium]
MTDKKRKGYATAEGQAAADKRYREKNKDYRNYLSSRSAARSFIRTKATIEDVEELQELLDMRIRTLRES